MRNPLIREYWFDCISRWKKSSLSQKNWCLEFGINPNTFCWWKQKLFPRKSIKETVLITFPSATNIFIYDHLIDIHSSFEKLSQLIHDSVPNEIIDSSFFVFLSTRRTYLKVFYYDLDGPNILFKRLERGAYVLNREIRPKVGSFSML